MRIIQNVSSSLTQKIQYDLWTRGSILDLKIRILYVEDSVICLSPHCVQEVFCMAQFSQYVHKNNLKRNSFIHARHVHLMLA